MTPEMLPQIFQPVVQLKPEMISIGGPGTRIDSFVKLEGGLGLFIGKGVHIASFVHLNIGGGKLTIEDYAAVASGAKIITGSNSPEGLSISASAPKEMQIVSPGAVRIGRFAALFTNAVVLPNCDLGEGAVLAAGAVATKSIPSWEIWGGVPARFLAKRMLPPPMVDLYINVFPDKGWS